MFIKILCQVKIDMPRVESPVIHRIPRILTIELILEERGQFKYLATSVAKGPCVNDVV